MNNSSVKFSNFTSNSNNLKKINSLSWLPKMQIICIHINSVYPDPCYITKVLWSMLISETIFPGVIVIFLCKLSICSPVTSGIHLPECKVMLDCRWICVSTLHFYILTFK